MNLELLQLAVQSTPDSSKNSISSVDQKNSSLVETASNDEFLQQLQQESKSYEPEAVMQKLPVNGKDLPSEEETDNNPSLAESDLKESTLLLSGDLINLNIVSAVALSPPSQPVVAPLDIKANPQQVALNRSVDVPLKNSELIYDETYTDFSDEEVVEVTSELVQSEFNSKNLMPIDVQSSDVKSSRGDAALAISSITSHLPLSSTSKPTGSTASLNSSLESPVSDHEAWGGELSNRMAWMVRQDIKVANLRLNPADLGPIEIRIQIKNEQIDVHFNSTHAQVREAIEVAVPRLREMFGEQLLRLDNVNVSQHSFEDQKERPRGRGEELAESEGRIDESESEQNELMSDAAIIVQGQIDYFI